MIETNNLGNLGNLGNTRIAKTYRQTPALPPPPKGGGRGSCQGLAGLYV